MVADSASLRKKVAKEAANLIYSGIEKEYKQAKVKAAQTFRTRSLPTNLEVAIELDNLVEENEGSVRKEHLIQMRKEALKLMKILEAYNPVLVGSVWRGTVHHGSDIDIAAHHTEPGEILKTLKQNNIKIVQAEWVLITKKGERKGAFHVYIESPEKQTVEIKIVDSEETDKKEKCEIYGDEIIGLKIPELEKLLKENPLQRFVPY